MKDLSLLSSYHFDLPAEQIAESPVEPRESARLLVVGKNENTHTHFFDLSRYLRAGDLLVINDARVQRARLYAKRATGGKVEILLTEDVRLQRRIACLHRSRRKLADGEILTVIGDETIRLRFERNQDTTAVTFLGTEAVVEILARIGQLPLPPYIVKKRQTKGQQSYRDSDDRDYQTVYASEGAAVAAPTAGLHFSHQQLTALAEMGVEIGRLRLDVGIGTFQPVRGENLDAHKMHEERYVIDQALAEQMAKARAAGNRVIAVGTTVVRALEDQAQRHGSGVVAGDYATSIFIRPGYTFQNVDGLVTNFHLPDSTLIVLVAAFAGYDRIMAAYREAIAQGYRFYSYGDAMLLLP